LGNSVLLAISSQRPERRYIPMILGMAILSGRFILSNKSLFYEGLQKCCRLAPRVLLHIVIFFPFFLFFTWSISPELGRWLTKWTPVIHGSQPVAGFNAQVFLLSPLYVLVVAGISVICREGKTFTGNRLLLITPIAALSAYLAFNWVILLCDYYSMSLTKTSRLLMPWIFFSLGFVVWGRLGSRKIGLSFLLAFMFIQGIQIVPWLFRPTFTIRDFGKEVVAITSNKPLVTSYSGPMIEKTDEIYYGYPVNGGRLTENRDYYILTCYKSNSFYLEPRMLYYPRERPIPEASQLVRNFQISPYGSPAKPRWILCLWETGQGGQSR
jgi:hypothetical protein